MAVLNRCKGLPEKHRHMSELIEWGCKIPGKPYEERHSWSTASAEVACSRRHWGSRPWGLASEIYRCEANKLHQRTTANNLRETLAAVGQVPTWPKPASSTPVPRVACERAWRWRVSSLRKSWPINVCSELSSVMGGGWWDVLLETKAAWPKGTHRCEFILSSSLQERTAEDSWPKSLYNARWNVLHEATAAVHLADGLKHSKAVCKGSRVRSRWCRRPRSTRNSWACCAPLCW